MTKDGKSSDRGDQSKRSNKSNRMFGKFLKTMRQKMQESLGETSGAVEIQVEQLDRFERGVEVPSEDILMLLISHFGLQDDEAVELWELAGYEQPSQYDNDRDSTHQQGRQALPVMLLAIDSRVLYSNNIEIESDDSGMVLHFSQASDKNVADSDQTTVSRIGISHDQAEKLLQNLQAAVLRKKYLSGPRQLPPSTEHT